MEKEEKNETQVGRTKIWDKRRTGSHSTRCENGLLDVVKRKCDFCGHHKAFIGNVGGLHVKKCCRCKHESSNEFKL